MPKKKSKSFLDIFKNPLLGSNEMENMDDITSKVDRQGRIIKRKKKKKKS